MLNDPVLDSFIEEFEHGRHSGVSRATNVLRPHFGRGKLSARQAWMDGYITGRSERVVERGRRLMVAVA